MSRPGWMDDSLEEEWVDQEEDMSIAQDLDALEADEEEARSGQGAFRARESVGEKEGSASSATAVSPQAGTFLIREEVLHEPVTPAKRFPGNSRPQQFAKSFFSPLALEKMFEPPSPPTQKTKPTRVTSRLAQSHLPEEPSISQEHVSKRGDDGHDNQDPGPDVIIESDIPNLVTFDGRKPSAHYSFTFNPPKDLSPAPALHIVDPRLRLFQTYDTYTKDHLSALVDSIAVKSTTESPSDDGYSRSSKRIKLSADDSDDDSPRRLSLSNRAYSRSSMSPMASRPNSRRDYVGESRSLMQQIKNNRSFSIATTVETEPVALSVVQEHEDESTNEVYPVSSPSRAVSSLAYRLQAASLMAQIKSDVQDDPPHGKKNNDRSDLTSSRDSDGSVALTRQVSPNAYQQLSVLDENSAEIDHSFSSSTRKRSRSPTPAPVIRIQPNSPTASLPDTHTLASSSPHHMNPPSPLPSHRHVDQVQNPDPSIQQSVPPNEAHADLARFVSSSTAQNSMLIAAQRSQSGASTSSADSGVKHAGTPHHNVVIRTIVPGEVGPITQVGEMVWDADGMKWTKTRRRKSTEADEDLSEDVFRDIESLKDGNDQSRDLSGAQLDSSISDVDEGDSFDDEIVAEAEARAREARESQESKTQDADGYDESAIDDSSDGVSSGGEEYLSSVRTEASHEDLQRNFASVSDEEPPEISQRLAATSRQASSLDMTPQRPILIPSQSTPHPFPYANAPARPSIPLIPPRSAMKQTPSGSLSSGRRGAVAGPSTPAPAIDQHKHRRSVSFSDGRKDGKIVELAHREKDVKSSLSDSPGLEEQSNTRRSGSLVPSVRTKRIDGMLAALEEGSSEDLITPSKSSASHQRKESAALVPLSARSSAFSHSHTRSESLSLVTRSEQPCESPEGTQRTTTITSHSRHTISVQANQTILTECSFAVTQDKLVQIITQIQPYEPYWENLPEIDLSGRGIESVARMKEFLPSLVTLDLHRNHLSYLSGVPSNVRTLRASNNMLTSVTAYSHLRNLEILDISHNSIESLTQLKCLPLLRELRADGNSISTVDGLEELKNLVKLSLKRNQINQINFRICSWPRLETLDLSSNRITALAGLSTLSSLLLLNLDHNHLSTLTSTTPIPRLRILRISGNRLTEFNAGHFPYLRILYMDGNRLVELSGMKRLSKLENLSLRNQSGGRLQLTSNDVRDVKRLYLSGNPLNALEFLTEPCYNLVYLELAGCRISTLPADLASMVPNVRVLNLNYNFITDTAPLQGLVRLKRLTLVGSRLKGTKTILKALKKMSDIEMIDLRMNPCTLGWYLPLLVRDVPGALQPSDWASTTTQPLIMPGPDVERGNDHSAVRLHPFSGQSMRNKDREHKASSLSGAPQHASWEDLDAKFRRDLPDDSYLSRLAYRGLVMRACPKVRTIDGINVSEGERDKADKLLQSVLKSEAQASRIGR